MLYSNGLINKFNEKKDFIEVFSMYGHRNRSLGLKRWDKFVEYYPFSGIVTVPVKMGGFEFRDPFYFAFEKLHNQELVFIKLIGKNRSQPFRLGDVYSFFGFKGFKGYKIGQPIFLVEGLSDWWVVSKYLYKYVLATFTSGLSWRQVYFLTYVTNDIIIGFDNDKAGNKAKKYLKNKFSKVTDNMRIRRFNPQKKDWGSIIEENNKRVLNSKILEFKNKFIYE